LSEKESVVKADSGEPAKKLVVVRSVIIVDSGAHGKKIKQPHFQGIVVNRPPLPSRSPVKEVHRIATCALGLKSYLSKRDSYNMTHLTA
jgi:hypothetical protein